MYCLRVLPENNFHNMICVLVCLVTINKIPRTGWFRQQTFISSQSGGWEAGFISGENLLSLLQMAVSLLYLHIMGSKKAHSLVSTYKGVNPVMRAPHS